VNLPDTIVDLPALSDKDKKDLRFGIEWDIDFIGEGWSRSE
jgi:pyruvate kinase